MNRQMTAQQSDAIAGRLLVLAGTIIVHRDGAKQGRGLIYNQPTRAKSRPRLCLRLEPNPQGYILDAWTWISRGDGCSGWVLAACCRYDGPVKILRLQRGRWEEELFALVEAGNATSQLNSAFGLFNAPKP